MTSECHRNHYRRRGRGIPGLHLLAGRDLVSTTDKWFLVFLVPVLLGVLAFLMFWNFEIAAGVITYFGQSDPTLSKGLAIVLDVVLIMGLLLRTRRSGFWVHSAIWVPLGFIIAGGIFTGFLAGGIPGAVIFVFPVLLLVITEQNLLPYIPGTTPTGIQKAPALPPFRAPVPTGGEKAPALPPTAPAPIPGDVEEIAREISQRDPIPGWVRVSREFGTNESRARRAVKAAKEVVND